MSNPPIPTILATDEHLIRCRVDTRGLRMLDILNDPNGKFLNIHEVEIYRRAADTPVASISDAVLNKRNIVLAIPALKKHEAPEKRAYSYTAKRVFDAYVIAGGYEIRGKLQNNATQDVAALLSQSSQFLPLPQASVSYGPCADDQPPTQVALVNTSFITMIHIGQEQDLSNDLVAAIREIVSS